jgi:hypothetical protein
MFFSFNNCTGPPGSGEKLWVSMSSHPLPSLGAIVHLLISMPSSSLSLALVVGQHAPSPSPPVDSCGVEGEAGSSCHPPHPT